MTVSRQIDLSSLPPPRVVEEVDVEAIASEVLADYILRYPQFTAALESDPVVKLIEQFAFREMLLRLKVNDTARSLLAPFASGSDLDSVVARQGIVRRVLKPATDTAPAVMESDASLLRQYLLSFSTASAGSSDSYKFAVNEAWPGVHDVAVLGQDVHGRRGDVEVVITAPGGAVPSAEEMAAVRSSVRASKTRPEATGVSVLPAVRLEYHPVLTVYVPPGPDPGVIKLDAVKRVRAACDARTFIGSEIPAGYLLGAVYGNNIVRATDDAPVVIPPDPYTVPVAVDITVSIEVLP